MNYYLGEIIAFAGAYVPENFMLCDGSSLSVNDYNMLYSVLGNIYGGNSTQFNLPNLQGLVVVGVGQKTGGSNYVLGQGGGQNTVTLTPAQIPSHNHALNAANAQNANTPNANGAVLAITNSTGFPSGASVVNTYTMPPTAPPLSNGLLDPLSVLNAGANVAHNNQQPYLAINYIICVNGLFPSPN